MPWHFGGDECLTYAEAKEFADVLDSIHKQRRKKAPRGRPGRRR